MLNSNFNFTTRYTEQDLVERLIIESIQIYGMDVTFCPKTIVDYDALLGEDVQKAFRDAFIIESYFENVDGFMGDKNFLNKLGLNIDKQATFIIAKRRFDEVILGLNWRDFWKETNSYAINDAVHYHGTVYINISPVVSFSLQLTNVTGSFNLYDPVMGVTSGATGMVNSFDPTTKILILTNMVGAFQSNEIINDTNTDPLNTATGQITTIISGTNIAPPTDTVHWKVMQQVRPKEGDLIYLPLTGDIFEILFAEHEEVFYQLGKIYVWKLTCEKFRFSHEEFATGVSDIDDIAAELENDGSINNDPLADNQVIDRKIENFLNLDPNSPF